MKELLSRKFIITVLVALMSYALVWSGKLDAKSWFEWAVGLVAVYSGANVLNKLTAK